MSNKKNSTGNKIKIPGKQPQGFDRRTGPAVPLKGSGKTPNSSGSFNPLSKGKPTSFKP